MGKINWGSLLIGAVLGVIVYTFFARNRARAT
jgi:hypothetical protein